MSIDTGIAAERTEGDRLAAAARSILSCPAATTLLLGSSVGGPDSTGDGPDDGTSTRDLTAYDEGLLDVQDHGGHPVLTCTADSSIAAAARAGERAVLRVRSGLGRPGSPDRDAVLVLSGRLEVVGSDVCRCCSETTLLLTLHPEHALLARDTTAGTAPAAAHRVRVPLEAFSSPAHDLNRGLLQRTLEYANLCHQDELRRAVAARTGSLLGDVLGVQLTWLHASGLALEWVDTTGGRSSGVAFPRDARDAADLGTLLRETLHAGLC